MNILFTFSLIALVINSVNYTSASSFINRRLQDVLILEILDIIKGVDKDVRIGKAMPDIDALQFENQHVDLCGPILCIFANLTKGALYGLEKLDVIKSDLNTKGSKFSIDIDVNFPSLRLDSEYYKMKGNIMGAFPLAGEGKLHFEVENFRLWMKVVLQITESGTSIEKFENPGFSIEHIFCRTEFDGNIDDIFNTMVEELLADYLNRFNKPIASYYCQMLKEIINPIL